MGNSNLTDTKGYIFDLDGTLYSQKNVRFHMGLRIIKAFFSNEIKIQDIKAIICFRKMHEDPKKSSLKMDELFSQVSSTLGIGEDQVSNTIKKWMFEMPLDLLRQYCYPDVKKFIDSEHKSGKSIIIYSDYPVLDKLKAMDISFSQSFVSGDPGCIDQKPSRGAMDYILNQIGIESNSLVYVGDRNDKDRASAELVNIKYYDIRLFRKLIK